MKVTAPYDCYLPAIEAQVAKGEVLDLDPQIASSLIEQGWKKPTAKKAATKAPKAKTSTATPAANPAPPDSKEE